MDVDVLRTLFLSPGDWIHRRVESVLMSPDGVTRRKVSLDVDLAARAPWPTDAAGRLLVPVTIQAKQPLRNFDAVCQGRGRDRSGGGHSECNTQHGRKQDAPDPSLSRHSRGWYLLSHRLTLSTFGQWITPTPIQATGRGL